MREQYKNSVDGYSGNEDCGQMSSWYILSSMGFYPTDPASGRFDFGSPQFKRVEIGLPSGKKFIITSDRKGDDDYIIKSIKLNGKVLHQHYITYKQIMDGGTLEYKMKKR